MAYRRLPISSTRFAFAVLCVVVLEINASNAAGERPVDSKAKKQPTVERSQPLEPSDAIEAFVLAPGVRIELVASEPEVIDPVAIRFDEHGRLWVVEMRDYPLGPKPGKPPASKIKILEDLDHDGRYETVHLFADELQFPTGIQPWRGGVFVTFAGKVAYLKDTDGDFKADTEEIWLTGFAEKNTQLRANHPTLGLDRKIYVANGLRGGEIKSTFDSKRDAVNLRSNDLRFDPLTRQFEPVAGISQYGMTLDDFGNRFLCNNRFPLMHVVIEDHYARRNPSYALSALTEPVALSGEDSRIYPICRSWTTSLAHAGQFTAACATTIYRGDGLPAEMLGNSFTCDPTGSLVHREILQQAGATFRSHPAREGVEFLASTDEWFRPVNLSVGPDGALYVVDMYRGVIEHPQFMPAELQKRPDLRNGDDHGRIYRLVADDSQPPFVVPKLSSATDQALVKFLEKKNAWTRETAARLLLERETQEVAKELEALTRNSKLPAARAAALQILSGTKTLSPSVVRTSLLDLSPGVRQQAIVLAERWASAPDSLRSDVLKLAYDVDPRVRFQVALSLAPMENPEEIEALKHIAISATDDIWTRRAVAIAMPNSSPDLLKALLADTTWYADEISSSEKQLLVDLTELVAKTLDPNQLLDIVRVLGELPPSDQVIRLQQITFSALFRRGNLRKALYQASEGDTAHQAVEKVFRFARHLVEDNQAETFRRVEAITLLGYDPESANRLAKLALEDPTRAVQLAAINALSNHSSAKPWKIFIEEFASLMPAVRTQVLSAMVKDPNRTTLLLDAVESGEILPTDIDRVSAEQLRRHRNKTLQERANQLLPAAVAKDRDLALADYQVTLKMPSDPARGREVFRKQCATCHSVAGIGVRVGPSIGDNYAKSQQQLLADIIQPNRAIDNNYVGYLVVTDDGKSYNGLLISESATSLTLLQEGNKKMTMAKTEVEEIRVTGLSLMPAGLEKNIPHQEMADLLSFLKNWRYLDGLTPYDENLKKQ